MKTSGIQANEFWMGWKISYGPRRKDGRARLKGVSLSLFSFFKSKGSFQKLFAIVRNCIDEFINLVIVDCEQGNLE